MSKKSDALSDFSGCATIIAVYAPDRFPELFGSFDEQIERVYRLWHNYKSCLKQDIDRANELEKMLDESIALMKSADEKMITKGVLLIQEMDEYVRTWKLK